MRNEIIQAKTDVNTAITGLQREFSPLDQKQREFQLFRKKYSSELELRLEAFSRGAIVLNVGHTQKFKERFPFLFSLTRVRRVQTPTYQGNKIVYKTERYYELQVSRLADWIEKLNIDQATVLLDFLAQEMNQGNLDDLLSQLKYSVEIKDKESSLFFIGSIARTMTYQDVNSKALLYLYSAVETRFLSKEVTEESMFNFYLQRIKEAIKAYKGVIGDRPQFLDRINKPINDLLDQFPKS
jgi:hypothetical protein